MLLAQRLQVPIERGEIVAGYFVRVDVVQAVLNGTDE